ncbi:tetraacyldisaccharide 4'-kinase [Parabacteroides sp. PF5-5]|uniref:tetraacyldisaccharide 4'-kinase n=1 Tax=unclassified Parabacteroides TaxID=2649774 RepID=UPI002473DD31|nr:MULTISPECIES: tetraacyldisaccharide 4'-kinase [unclassified Parabacteroides]MDH6306178.1 tetraacyldisaccharide 4'-kinase [Parabacteroides sp. PH5-39]MDH6317137.1 tetraacyldisaccharide 4'-kinase [Parabacteroides sp. PF5-13]MDH6320890.1 tetraacyldisaccharide 4'-kinase [Parabacteroides sp. PH5-13]MDH6324621.1 tetraacyldisaccharide 4'-kinase [Parabacteroides sp. PH5-8]MDH6328328.1 tetraacyldisaccharide 4'-kinase [Parabacteroides sp. PH5-41]
MPTDRSFKLNYFFLPFSFLYGIGIRIRNLFFNWGLLSSEEFPVPVISVGNLSVGGTGKTPHVEYLIRLLKDQYKIAILSRGYKRSTKGYVLANEKSSAQTIGDEPYQIKRKFPDIPVAVDSDRRRGIKQLLALPDDQKPEVILLDDGYQHRYVTPSFSIVLTDYNRLFYLDKLLPTGRLREPASEINRADVVIVTKCPKDLKPIDFRIIKDEMKLFAHQQIYFTSVVYENLEPLFPEKAPLKSNIKKDDKLLLLAGVAAPAPFVDKVKNCSDHVISQIYPDHHTFSKQDIKKISETFTRVNSPDKYILVTEKDAARLQKNPLIPEDWKDALYYLPITIRFEAEAATSLDDLVLKHIVSFNRNSILRKYDKRN